MVFESVWLYPTKYCHSTYIVSYGSNKHVANYYGYLHVNNGDEESVEEALVEVRDEIVEGEAVVFAAKLTQMAIQGGVIVLQQERQMLVAKLNRIENG